MEKSNLDEMEMTESQAPDSQSQVANSMVSQGMGNSRMSLYSSRASSVINLMAWEMINYLWK